MELFTWEYLATGAGATAATTIITQFIKGLPVIQKLPTQLVSYIVALAIMLSAAISTGAVTSPSSVVLILFNAVVVMLASNGAYDTVAKTKTNKNS